MLPLVRGTSGKVESQTEIDGRFRKSVVNFSVVTFHLILKVSDDRITQKGRPKKDIHVNIETDTTTARSLMLLGKETK